MFFKEGNSDDLLKSSRADDLKSHEIFNWRLEAYFLDKIGAVCGETLWRDYK